MPLNLCLFLFSFSITTAFSSTMKPDSAKEVKTSLYWIIAIAVLVLFVGVLVAGLVLYKRMDLCYILLVIILQAF